jgi:electron transfer flavoprotein beta subunit
MRIVVLVKHVPDSSASWHFRDDQTLDRAGVESRLSELDEYAVEQALRLADNGLATRVTYLTMGPAKAVEAVRKALAMGGDDGVHVLDDALHGSDAVGTSLVLAKAVERIGFDLVVCGMASTDAEMSVVPTMIADRLGVPQVTNAGQVRVADGVLTARRDGDVASEEVQASVPAVVSVTDQTGEPRYPSFKSIMAAKKKPVQTWSLADLGVNPARVGLAAAASTVRTVTPRPPKEAGTVIVDDGTAASQLADFLVAHKFL